jgi:NAD(P)H dehydrogenase (quinone)
MQTRALLVLGHPDPRSFNAALTSAYAAGWAEGGGEHRILDLGSLAFDPVLRGGHRNPQPLEPDLQEAQRAIERADHVAWFFPVYWGSPPALVRGFVDRVFLPGWGFQYRGGALPDGLLRGRSSRVVSTMDSPSWWYAIAHRWALHATMGTGTLSFCGFAPVRFSLLHRVREMEARERTRWLERMKAIGRADHRARVNPRGEPRLEAPERGGSR